MSETILYTHVKIQDSSYCNKAKELFEQNNIEFSMQTVGEDLTPRDLYNKSDHIKYFHRLYMKGNI